MTIFRSHLAQVTAAIGLVITVHPVAAQDKDAPPALRIPPPAPPAAVRRPPLPPIQTQPTIKTYEQEASAAHYDLIDAIEEGVDQNLALENGLAAMRRTLAQDPTISALEKESPGLIEEVSESMRPIFVAHSKRVREHYAPQMAALFARYFTDEEAQQLSAFYRSDLGRRLLKLVSRNYTVDAVFEDYETTAEITRDQLDRDMDSTVATTLGTMAQEDVAALEREITTNPALVKMGIVNFELRGLKLRMENEPLTPEAESEMEQAMLDVFARRFGK